MKCSVKYPVILILTICSLLNFTSCNKASLPAVTTSGVDRIAQRTAYAGGHVTSDGGAIVIARGVCWSTSENPTLNDGFTADSIGTGAFSSYITGLSASTTYYVRAYATNREGTVYGSQVSFTTIAVGLPILDTSIPKTASSTTARGGGIITSDGGTDITERGVCWNTIGSPTIADDHTSEGPGSAIFKSILTGLVVNTSYSVRSYAINSIGIAYGSELIYTQLEPVTDIDGNVYSIITVGNQTWLGENLKTTTYNNGTAIPLVSGKSQWEDMTGPAFCWYDNDEAGNKEPYGALYNWYAVNTGKLCPLGWHVPTDTEFTTLINFAGGESSAGAKLKEAGNTNWSSPNSGATDLYGFSALPGGGRWNVYSQGATFGDQTYYGYLWSSTESTTVTTAWSRDMGYNLLLVNKGQYSKQDGESVRCIMNNP